MQSEWRDGKPDGKPLVDYFKNLNAKHAQYIAKLQYDHLYSFVSALGLKFEPALKSVHAAPYSCSNTLQTSMIGSGYQVDSRLLTGKDIKNYRRSFNHQGYKKPNQLFNATKYRFKPCGFLHALAPSSIVKSRKTKTYLAIKDLLHQLTKSKSFSETKKIHQRIEYYENQPKHYTSKEFLHYRFWFLDLDWSNYYTPDQILKEFDRIGLKQYIAAIVKTSPTKYHVYFHSELIASTKHVENWPHFLLPHEQEKYTNEKFLRELKQKYPNYTGKTWFDLSLRGVPDRMHLRQNLPSSVQLRKGVYCGDDYSYEKYIFLSKMMAGFFKGDSRVYNETRIAQLPGYYNPKNNYLVNMVYANKKAGVLTVENLESIALKYFKNKETCLFQKSSGVLPLNKKLIEIVSKDKMPYKKPVNNDRLLQRIHLLDETVACLETPTPVTKESTSRSEKKRAPIENLPIVENSFSALPNLEHLYIPESPEMYARLNRLEKEIIWSKDINHHSNHMLLLLTRFSFRYVDPKDISSLNRYFECIIQPYFKNRDCEAVRQDPTLKKIKERFFSMAKHNGTSAFSKKKPECPFSPELQESLCIRFVNNLKARCADNSKYAKSLERKRVVGAVEKIFHKLISYSDGKIYKYDKLGNVFIKCTGVPSAILVQHNNYKDKFRLWQKKGLLFVDKSVVVNKVHPCDYRIILPQFESDNPIDTKHVQRDHDLSLLTNKLEREDFAKSVSHFYEELEKKQQDIDPSIEEKQRHTSSWRSKVSEVINSDTETISFEQRKILAEDIDQEIKLVDEQIDVFKKKLSDLIDFRNLKAEKIDLAKVKSQLESQENAQNEKVPTEEKEEVKKAEYVDFQLKTEPKDEVHELDKKIEQTLIKLGKDPKKDKLLMDEVEEEHLVKHVDPITGERTLYNGIKLPKQTEEEKQQIAQYKATRTPLKQLKAQYEELNQEFEEKTYARSQYYKMAGDYYRSQLGTEEQRGLPYIPQISEYIIEVFKIRLDYSCMKEEYSLEDVIDLRSKKWPTPDMYHLMIEYATVIRDLKKELDIIKPKLDGMKHEIENRSRVYSYETGYGNAHGIVKQRDDHRLVDMDHFYEQLIKRAIRDNMNLSEVFKKGLSKKLMAKYGIEMGKYAPWYTSTLHRPEEHAARLKKQQELADQKVSTP